MGDHHKLKYKSKTDTDLFRTRLQEESEQLAFKHQSSEAQLKTVHHEQPTHRAHGSCVFHGNFFNHKPLPVALRQSQTNLADTAKGAEFVRLRHNTGQPNLFNNFARPVRRDGQPSLPQLKIR